MKRNTWQREAVRGALDSAEGFVSAQSLYSALREGGSSIGLATVYRALADLAAEGDADSLVQDGESLYRACTPGSHHHHLICRNCGLTVEIAAEPIEQWAHDVAQAHGFSDPQHIVDVFGVCSSCAAAAVPASTVAGSTAAP